MFILEENPTFTHTVTAKVPVDGGFKEETFKATFRVLPPEDLDQHDTRTSKGSADFLKLVVVSLDDIAGPDKKPIPYSDELRDKVIALPYVRRALSDGYIAALVGARLGN